LVVGGTGHFGRLLIDDLLDHAGCDLRVASRRAFRSERFETVVADLWNPSSLERALSGVSIAICAAGPFQKLPVSLAEICVRQGIHYMDLADDRGFVGKIRALAANKNDGPAICTGWSTVSALSGALAQVGAEGLNATDSIYIHMAPGNRGARQAATIASLMHSVGKPFTVFRDGAWHNATGWSEPRDFAFPPPIGLRRGYLVDVPDHEILPELLGARTVEFRAGSELHLLNRCISLLRRTRRSWVEWSAVFQRAAALLSWIGHDWGALGVEVSGSFSRRRISVIADSAGERIAVMPASIMASALLSGAPLHGLVPPTHWLTHKELRGECEKRGFRLVVEEI